MLLAGTGPKEDEPLVGYKEKSLPIQENDKVFFIQSLKELSVWLVMVLTLSLYRIIKNSNQVIAADCIASQKCLLPWQQSCTLVSF